MGLNNGAFNRLSMVAIVDDRGHVVFNTVIGDDGAACANNPGSVAYYLAHYIDDETVVAELFGRGGLVEYEPVSSYAKDLSADECGKLDDGPMRPGVWHYGGMCFKRGTGPISAIIGWVMPKKMRDLSTFVYHLRRQGTPHAYVFQDGRWLCNIPMMRDERGTAEQPEPFVALDEYLFGSASRPIRP